MCVYFTVTLKPQEFTVCQVCPEIVRYLIWSLKGLEEAVIMFILVINT